MHSLRSINVIALAKNLLDPYVAYQLAQRGGGTSPRWNSIRATSGDRNTCPSAQLLITSQRLQITDTTLISSRVSIVGYEVENAHWRAQARSQLPGQSGIL